jgi:hypothetical protein
MARETVMAETPAWAATSSMVMTPALRRTDRFFKGRTPLLRCMMTRPVADD